MTARRTLALRRELLTELGEGDLSVVLGAALALPTEPFQICVISRISPVACGGPPGSSHCPQ